jgi:hypothetical protein
MVSLPLPPHFLHCLPLFFPFGFPFFVSILYYLPFPGPFLTALCVILMRVVIIFIGIAWIAPSSTSHSGICPDLIIIILVDYLIWIEWSHGQYGGWLVL